MEVATTPVPPQSGGFRGRGRGGGGGFDRGRRGMPRGMGRGNYAMMSGGRGMRPRGGPPQGYRFQGFPPRGAGGPMRGSRPPLYGQPPKPHTGIENNKVVPDAPAPAAAGTPTVVTPAAPAAETSVAPTVAAAPNNTTTVAVPATPVPTTPAVVGTVESNGNANGPPQHSHPRGSFTPRGRGGYSRGGGRGGYNSQSNHIKSQMHHHSMGPPGSVEHGNQNQMPIRRGAPRGRGGYGMTRPPIHQSHHMNMHSAPTQTLKRGAPTGPPGPKRGRFEGGPYSQRPMTPKYHHQQAPQHVASMQPMQQNYAPPPPPPNHHQHHAAPQGHHGYPPHDQSQAVDPYAQSYAAPTQAQTSYNGYSQGGAYGAHGSAAPQQTNAGYGTSHHAATNEYDQSAQYQGYSAASYGGHQDTRYQSYGQDYTQQYGAPAVDYNTGAQADYSQHQGQQAYDERAYAGYDQSYQQGYSNAAGYY